jgi:hypothetical protein
MTAKALMDGEITMTGDARRLSRMARLAFSDIVAIANFGDGYLRIGSVAVAPARALCAGGLWREAELRPLLAEMVEAGLLEEDDEGWCVPVLRARAALRAKRQDAGRRGGAATAEINSRRRRRRFGFSAVCYSTPESRRKSGVTAEQQKKKKNQKEKNINKYIYFFSERVFINDRGSREAGNGAFSDTQNFTVYKQEYRTLQRLFPEMAAEWTGEGYSRLDRLLHQHDRWMATRPDVPRYLWYVPFLAMARAWHEEHHGLHPSRLPANDRPDWYRSPEPAAVRAA